MSDYEYDYEEADEQESETTLQSAREELEYWTEFFQEQKDEKPEEWMFYRNPFLDPSVYAYWILTEACMTYDIYMSNKQKKSYRYHGISLKIVRGQTNS